MDDKDRPADDLESTELSPPSASSAEQIGPYRLLQKLGEGGMGEVWLAEQQEPVTRKVALKVIKAGMDTKQVVARFEAERQALAMMDHPAVAKVFDAGTTPRGLPYFVMEYVKGVPINKHCDTHRLSTRERLELFQQVCEGVQHAHQKAIIHRDLKPTNVLVTEQDGKRLPKIIDFGVAKATAQKLTEKTMFTELGVLIGTPEYMSPEQAELTGEDVDTRTDVYSLGVILYELLVGALPFDPKELRSGGFEGIRKKIREEEPHKPSTRLSTLGDQSTESARARRVDLPTLQRQLRGDLDWITMRALEKDRSRRYGSPMDLAVDIERHLKHEPVLASPPSAVYRAKKLVRRHTAGVVAAAVGLVVLIAFAGTMAVQANRVAAERDRANAEAERANREAEAKGQVAEFLKDLFTVSDPGEARGNSITARELLDKGAEKIEQLEDEVTRAELMGTMGGVYYNLGLYPEAETLLKQAVSECKRVLGDEHPDTLSAMNSLTNVYGIQNRDDETLPIRLELLEIATRRFGDDDLLTLMYKANLGLNYWALRRYDEAEPLLFEAFEVSKRARGDEDWYTLQFGVFLADLYTKQGRYDEAEPLYLESLEAQSRLRGEDHRRTVETIHSLGTLYYAQDRLVEAERLLLQAVETRRLVLGDHHLETLSSMNNLALVYAKQGRYDEAEPLYLESLEGRKRLFGDDHWRTLEIMHNLADLHSAQGRYEEAEALHLETLQARKLVFGDDHPDTLGSFRSLVTLYGAWGRPARAAEWRAKLAPEE